MKKKRRFLEQMRKKKAGTKRVLAAFLALALAGSYIPSIPASAEEPDAELLLDFPDFLFLLRLSPEVSDALSSF